MNIFKGIKRNYWAETIVRKARAAIGYRQFLAKNFSYWYKVFAEAECWDIERTQNWQRQALFALLSKLPANSPYHLDHELNFSSSTDPLEIVNFFPVIDRDGFRMLPSHVDSFAKRDLAAGSTSGTSGNALQFFHAKEDYEREWAAICHQWRRVGFDPYTSVRAEFRGLVKGGKLVQQFPDLKMIRCSILHTQTKHVQHYAEACRRARVEFLHGYPSALYLVANQMLTNGIKFEGIRGIMLASEMIYPHQLDTLAEAFPKAKIIAHYGNAERSALGAWCEQNNSYHFLPLYSLVEVDPIDGTLIGTNLFNTVNPFIRYRMDDNAAGVSYGACPECGRLGYPLVEQICGRAEDYLYSPERGWIPPAIVTYPLKSLQAIHEIQLFQSVQDQIELRYTSINGGDCTRELVEVAQGLGAIIPGVRILPKHYETLTRGSTGKFKWIISTLPKAQIGV